jgi:transposase
MVTIGVDPHKRTHTAVAADELGRALGSRTERAERDGFGALLLWARALAGGERVWVIEDCRHVSGPFERFLLDHGETLVRLAPRLMAGARQSVREPGKSDPIDALAVARAALREGLETLPAARLSGVELEVRLLGVHRERLVQARIRLINELRWQLHDLWLIGRSLNARWIAPAGSARSPAACRPPSPARGLPSRAMRSAGSVDLSKTIGELYEQLAGLVAQVAPQLLAERGIGGADRRQADR